MTAPRPTFPPPAAEFDAPLGMLHSFHVHVHRSLSLLRTIGERVAAGRVDESVHSAAAEVLHYFDEAAPQHHEDEEQHIFPLVLAHAGDDSVRAAVMKLQEDHVAMEAQWARVRVPLAALAHGLDEAHDALQIAAASRFCALYDGHAECEEGLVFPLAARLLDSDALHAIGKEMARRRATTPCRPRPKADSKT